HAAARLLIAPDGPLWEVPFAALVINTRGVPQYLGLDKAITYTPSLTLFAQARRDGPARAKRQKPTAVVVGNPIFDRPPANIAAAAPTSFSRRERHYLFTSGTPPAPLPATRTEAIKVAQLYDGYPLLGANATETALRERIGSADVIHLATHGYF